MPNVIVSHLIAGNLYFYLHQVIYFLRLKFNMAGRRAIKLLQKSINQKNRRRQMIVLLEYIMYRRRMMLSMCLAKFLLISRLNA